MDTKAVQDLIRRSACFMMQAQLKDHGMRWAKTQSLAQHAFPAFVLLRGHSARLETQREVLTHEAAGNSSKA